MSRSFASSHLLAASNNPLRLISSLQHLIDANEIEKLHAELHSVTARLFKLGHSHYDFAIGLSQSDWRQQVSRLYYGAYNAKRAVALINSGHYSTDSSDHQRTDDLPGAMANKSSHQNKLKSLREDRNLCDYSFSASVTDLVLSPHDATAFCRDFLQDCKAFLIQKGVQV
jgi:hypothetical protein